MERKILVAYATTHGAMKEVAAVVAEELRGQGGSADLLPAREVKSVQEYSAVVLGAPLYILHLHKDAARFLNRHQAALARLPVAVFAGGPFNDKEEDWQEVRKEMDSELAKFAWLRPASTLVVGGRFDPSGLRFPYSLIPALKNTPPSDLRDWDAIRAWACSLSALFISPQEDQSLTAP